jgi:hypothetical protein
MMSIPETPFIPSKVPVLGTRPADLVFDPTSACRGVRGLSPLLPFSRPGRHLISRRGRTYL